MNPQCTVHVGCLSAINGCAADVEPDLMLTCNNGKCVKESEEKQSECLCGEGFKKVRAPDSINVYTCVSK